MRRNSDLMEFLKVSILVLLLVAILWLLPTYSKQTHAPQYDFRNWIVLHTENSIHAIAGLDDYPFTNALVQAIKQGKHTPVEGFYFSGPYFNTTSSPLKIELTLKPDQSYVVKAYLPNGQTQVVDRGPTSLSVRAIGYIYEKNLPILDKQVVYNALIEHFTTPFMGNIKHIPAWYYDKTYSITKELNAPFPMPPHLGFVWIWTPVVITTNGLVDVYKDGVYIGRYRWFSRIPELTLIITGTQRPSPNLPIACHIYLSPWEVPPELKPYNRLHLKDNQSANTH